MTQALVLSGGGARGAYQAGAVKALATLFHQQAACPFPIITGASAGAINAAFLAANAHDFSNGTQRLADLWSGLTTDRIYQTNVSSLGAMAFKLLSDLMFGGFKKHLRSKSLLDTSPLKQLLEETIDFSRIQSNIDQQNLQSLEISATDYSSSENVSFLCQHNQELEWKRVKRRSEHVHLTSHHILASSAIPIFFPPVKVGDGWFGDGCLRNSAPLSPAVRLGASKILIIGVKKQKLAATSLAFKEISMGRILGVLLNSIFMDAIDEDLERLRMLNHAVEKMPNAGRGEFRKIETLSIMPSIDIGILAEMLAPKLPKTMHYLINGLGSNQEASEIISYLMFEPEFCSSLVECGYNDVIANQDRILEFLQPKAKE